MTDDELLARAKVIDDKLAQGLASLIERHRTEVERLNQECFRLAANQCQEGYGDEYGNHRCRAVDKLRTAEAEIERLTRERDYASERAEAAFLQVIDLETKLGDTESALAAAPDDGADRVISDLLIASAPYADMDETGRLPKAREQAERLLNEPDLSAKQRYANHYEEQIGFLVERFAEALSSKLRKAERKYQYQGAWRRDSWHDALVQQIRRHMDKGDPLDVAAYCAFAWHHGWTLAAPHTSAEAALAAAQKRVGVLQNVAGETLAALDKLDPLQAVLPVQQANLRAALAGGTAGDGGQVTQQHRGG